MFKKVRFHVALRVSLTRHIISTCSACDIEFLYACIFCARVFLQRSLESNDGRALSPLSSSNCDSNSRASRAEALVVVRNEGNQLVGLESIPLYFATAVTCWT